MRNGSFIRRVLYISLSILIVVVFLPLLLAILVPIFIYREIIFAVVKFWKWDEFDAPVAPLGALQVSEEIYQGQGRIHSTACFLTLRGPVNIAKIRQVFTKHAVNKRDAKTGKLVNPELQQNVKYWMGYPFWRHLSGYDIRDVVYAYQNDENFTCTEAFAEELTKKLMFTPFPPNKPLWEAIILPNLVSEDGNKSSNFGIVIRSHHVLSDGFNMLRIFQKMSDKGEEFNFIKPRDYFNGLTAKGPSKLEILVKWAKFVLRVPSEVGEFLVDLALNETWDKVHERGIGLKMDLDGSHRGDRVITKRAEKIQDISDISKIKDIHGVSGTSVLYSAITGAVRNSIFHKSSQIPYSTFIVTPFPLPSAGEKLENSFTLGYLNVELANPDPVSRLKGVHEELEKSKASTLPAVVAVCMKLGGCLPRSMVHFIFERSANSSTIMVSNLAGPKGNSDVAGHELLSYKVSQGGPANATVLGVCMSSIRGKLQITVSADMQTLHSEEVADEFLDNFAKELEYLKKSEKLE